MNMVVQDWDVTEDTHMRTDLKQVSCCRQLLPRSHLCALPFWSCAAVLTQTYSHFNYCMLLYMHICMRAVFTQRANVPVNVQQLNNFQSECVAATCRRMSVCAAVSLRRFYFLVLFLWGFKCDIPSVCFTAALKCMQALCFINWFWGNFLKKRWYGLLANKLL